MYYISSSLQSLCRPRMYTTDGHLFFETAGSNISFVTKSSGNINFGGISLKPLMTQVCPETNWQWRVLRDLTTITGREESSGYWRHSKLWNRRCLTGTWEPSRYQREKYCKCTNPDKRSQPTTWRYRIRGNYVGLLWSVPIVGHFV